MKHTPAYRARRQRMRRARKHAQRMRLLEAFGRTWREVAPLTVTVHADVAEFVAQLERAREQLAGLFADPQKGSDSCGVS